ncbi:MAG: hypothetical protein EXR24_04670 [Ignavibacteria bacterium]|nr:hypothetical protein [Ignavibacteria bacterium]
MYINAKQGSLFPIFPWMGFVFSGVVAAFLYSKYKLDESINKKIIYLSIIVLLLTIIIKLIPFSFYVNYNYYRTSPNFFFQRLAIVTLMLGLFSQIESKNKLKNSFVNFIGSESLIVYSVHLLIIFGLFFDNKSLSFIIGRTQDFSTTILWSISLVILMTLVAFIWKFIKQKNMTYARIIQYSILAIAIVMFFIRKY